MENRHVLIGDTSSLNGCFAIVMLVLLGDVGLHFFCASSCYCAHSAGDQEAVCQGGSQISGVGRPKEGCTLLKRYVFP